MIFSAREMAQLRHLDVLASKVVKGPLQGEREMLRSGPGSGFREHRAYHEGDPLRRVDWNVYARMGSLVVKEFHAEEALDLVVVQDRSESMRGKAALCAAKIAGALGAIALNQLDRFVLVPVGGNRPAETYSGKARIRELLETVDAEVSGGTDLLGAVRAGLPRTGRAGVAVVVSDFFDPRGATAAISYLLSRRYLVRAILIEDLEALAPPEPGRTRLVDVESGRTLRIDITPEAIEAYVRAREARVAGLRDFCKRSGATFLRARADQSFSAILQAMIVKAWLTV